MHKTEDLILLNMLGVGKTKLEKLSKAELQKKLKDAKNQQGLEAELDLIKKHKVRVMTIFDRDYPDILKEIHSPPLVLYVKGRILQNDEFAVAIVGSRIASIYGNATAEKLGYELASRGVVVVSGLAKGVDSSAHSGALKAHCRTIAVLGNGLKDVYPPENKRLAGEIVEKGGALISEFPMAEEPLAYNFPRRNRVISGLSLAVIVVEAAKNSGALITADFALEQDREVFAVPGKIDSATSYGTNELIKQGAKLIQTADDVLEELKLKLGDAGGGRSKPPAADLTGEEKIVYKNLSREPRYLDEIVRSSGVSVNRAAGLLLGLELRRLVKELPGKNFVRV